MEALAAVRALIGPAPPGGHRRGLLVEHLHLLHDAFGGLQKRHLVALAEEMNLPMVQVYKEATSHPQFDIVRDGEPRGSLPVRVCEGLPCAMAGGHELRGSLGAFLGGVKVSAAPCMGRCDQAPAAMVGQVAVPRAEPESIMNVLLHESSRPPFDQGRVVPAPVLVDYDEYRGDGGYALAAAVVNGEEDAEFVLQALDDSGLRDSRNGAAVGGNWRQVRQLARERSAVASLTVDIDERETGAFKARHYLERDPHRFIEGALVAAHVVGADAVSICLRPDYHECRAMLEAELAALAAEPPCRLPRIELRRGGGAHAGGEAPAPMLEQDFETLYWVRDILRRGPRWFAEFGRNGRHGLRSFSVSGRVAQPGVKLAPAGITLRELVDEYCGGMAEGHTLYAYFPGGASQAVLAASAADLPLDFDTLIVLGPCDKGLTNEPGQATL